MKRKILTALFLIYIASLILLGGYLGFENDRLKNVIVEQNEFIKQVTGKDSVFINQTNKYQDSLSQYTEKISFHLKGKPVTSDQFIDAYRKLEDERDSLKDVYDYARKAYGFDIKVTKKETKNTITTTLGPKGKTRADSADITYYFFKDRIKFKKGSWYADLTSKEDVEEVQKEIDEMNRKLKAALDSAKKTN